MPYYAAAEFTVSNQVKLDIRIRGVASGMSRLPRRPAVDNIFQRLLWYKRLGLPKGFSNGDCSKIPRRPQ